MHRLVPEWSVQDAIQLTWPHADGDWAPMLDAIEATLEQMALVIARYQSLVIGVADETTRRRLERRLIQRGAEPERLHLVIVESDDTWARDHGPLATRDGDALRMHDFVFTGWGGKFPADRDNRLTQALDGAGLIACDVESHALVLEGGALETDGQGTLLTTEACLLNPNRNPELSRGDVEARLAETLGIERVLWLAHGHLEGDDTDSHVDTLARFCDPSTIAYVRCDDPEDIHHAALAAMEAELKALRQPDGSPYRLIALPWPQACFDPEDGHRLPATYANFVIINGAVLVPTYADRRDLDALAALAEAFPGRDIIPLDATTVIRQHGSLHCLTMQWPAGTLARPDKSQGATP
ncbi:agmatine deiminase family protein [Halomonas sp. V046]|uniref:agmatine deiminase family protein n=1 Tax=Halomonas sp. V046 TaxID=3459611 RepID=UPI00404459CC